MKLQYAQYSPMPSISHLKNGRVYTLFSESSRIVYFLALAVIFMFWSEIPFHFSEVGAQEHRLFQNSTSLSSVVMNRLSNGTRLILKPEPDSEMLCISVFIRIPHAYSALERATSEVVSRSLFGASSIRTSDDINREIAKIGGSLDVLRTADYISISCYTSAGQFQSAVHLLCTTLTTAAFTAKNITHIQNRLISERLDHASSLENELRDVIQITAEEPVLDLNLISKITPELATQYYRTVFNPYHTVIAAAGKFDTRAAFRDISELLKEYTAESDLAIFSEPMMKLGSQAGKSIKSGSNSKMDRVILAIQAPRVSSPDYAAFTVLQCALGAGHGSRLIRRIRDDAGVGYQIGTSYRPDVSAPLLAYLEWDGHTASESSNAVLIPSQGRKLIEKEIDTLIMQPLSNQELERAKGLSIGLDLQRHERLRERAFMPAWYEAMGVGFDFDSAFATKILNVSTDDVLRAAKRYFPNRAGFISQRGSSN